jgi:hypothetical protein
MSLLKRIDSNDPGALNPAPAPPPAETDARVGLLSGAGGPVPLLGVAVEAELRDFAVRQTITQHYRNMESGPIEAVYVFPLDDSSAVCGFSAVIGDRVVTGQVEERSSRSSARLSSKPSTVVNPWR